MIARAGVLFFRPRTDLPATPVHTPTYDDTYNGQRTYHTELEIFQRGAGTNDNDNELALAL